MPVTIPAAGRVVVVQIPGGERRQLEERRAGIEQPVDPLAHRQLALLAVALQVACARRLAAPAAVRSRSSATSAGHPRRGWSGRARRWIDWVQDITGLEIGCRSAHQPQQSVLKPQAGQRQTACIRNISAPQRSQSTLSASAAELSIRRHGLAGGGGIAGRTCAGLYAGALQHALVAWTQSGCARMCNADRRVNPC